MRSHISTYKVSTLHERSEQTLTGLPEDKCFLVDKLVLRKRPCEFEIQAENVIVVDVIDNTKSSQALKLITGFTRFTTKPS